MGEEPGIQEPPAMALHLALRTGTPLHLAARMRRPALAIRPRAVAAHIRHRRHTFRKVTRRIREEQHIKQIREHHHIMQVIAPRVRMIWHIGRIADPRDILPLTRERWLEGPPLCRSLLRGNGPRLRADTAEEERYVVAATRTLLVENARTVSK